MGGAGLASVGGGATAGAGTSAAMLPGWAGVRVVGGAMSLLGAVGGARRGTRVWLWRPAALAGGGSDRGTGTWEQWEMSAECWELGAASSGKWMLELGALGDGCEELGALEDGCWEHWKHWEMGGESWELEAVADACWEC